MQAVAQAAAALAETSAESPTVEAKPDVQPQPQAASMAMPTPPAEPAGVKSTSAGAGPHARTLEQVIGELLEPVIRQWLEANLPRLVEELVRKEVARAIAVERPTSVV
jgi:cell pole-organizing protein PopZ